MMFNPMFVALNLINTENKALIAYVFHVSGVLSPSQLARVGPFVLPGDFGPRQALSNDRAHT
jgi:hypothetical protein